MNAPELIWLPRPSSENSTWTICPNVLIEIRDSAGEWAGAACLETVEAIAIEVQRRILCGPAQSRVDQESPDPLDDPRVKALVEALESSISPFDWETADMFYKRLREFNNAALAAMKGGK